MSQPTQVLHGLLYMCQAVFPCGRTLNSVEVVGLVARPWRHELAHGGSINVGEVTKAQTCASDVHVSTRACLSGWLDEPRKQSVGGAAWCGAGAC